MKLLLIYHNYRWSLLLGIFVFFFWMKKKQNINIIESVVHNTVLFESQFFFCSQVFVENKIIFNFLVKWCDKRKKKFPWKKSKQYNNGTTLLQLLSQKNDHHHFFLIIILKHTEFNLEEWYIWFFISLCMVRAHILIFEESCLRLIYYYYMV